MGLEDEEQQRRYCASQRCFLGQRRRHTTQGSLCQMKLMGRGYNLLERSKEDRELEEAGFYDDSQPLASKIAEETGAEGRFEN
jgi:hypothetical protein